ncbi:hypothetical protein BDL97_02G098200 [Sphagnum fallax]|nr:hypothetical protein BDL97_02G098200 [Sphagnum fallax]
MVVAALDKPLSINTTQRRQLTHKSSPLSARQGRKTGRNEDVWNLQLVVFFITSMTFAIRPVSLFLSLSPLSWSARQFNRSSMFWTTTTAMIDTRVCLFVSFCSVFFFLLREREREEEEESIVDWKEVRDVCAGKSLEYRCRCAVSHLFSLLMFNTLLTTRGSRESSEMSSELSSTQDGVSISVATISGLNSQCTSWAHNGSREPSETSSELSAQYGVSSTSVATTSGLNSPTATAGGVEEAAAENDDVKVIVCLVDATDRMLTKYALNFAITECASRGDTIFLLGLLQGIPAVRTTGRTHPPPLLDSNYKIGGQNRSWSCN